jgi:hypothetical protein
MADKPKVTPCNTIACAEPTINQSCMQRRRNADGVHEVAGCQMHQAREPQATGCGVPLHRQTGSPPGPPLLSTAAAHCQD